MQDINRAIIAMEILNFQPPDFFAYKEHPDPPNNVFGGFNGALLLKYDSLVNILSLFLFEL